MADIYFAQIREDSEIERRLLSAMPTEHVVCIGSGGCTAFSLADSATSISVVDVNPSQIYLVELKLAAARTMELDQYLAFIGEKPSTSRLEDYEGVKGTLSSKAVAYWDKHVARITRGVNRSGATERFYAHFSNLLCNVVLNREVVHGLFECGSIEEQVTYYERHFGPPVIQAGLKLALSKTVQTLFYPCFWYERSGEFDFYDYFVERLSHEVATRLLRDNYFLSQMMLGEYLFCSRGGVPHYLTPAGFQSLKQHASRYRLINSTLQSFLTKTSNVGAYFLSNVFDWGRPSDHAALQRSILASADTRAIMLTRSMYQPFTFDREILSGYEVECKFTDMARATDRSVLYRDIKVGILQ